MWNKRKITGLLLGLAGVLIASSDSFFPIEKNILVGIYAAGVLLAFIGIAVYGSGMPSSMKRYKACPGCYTRNDAAATVCSKCKEALLVKAPPRGRE
jgi:drug/metabolite transporter (DMT)-like permease